MERPVAARASDRQALRRLDRRQDEPVHVFHEVEDGAGDAGVVAQRERAGNRHPGRREARQDVVLARHVVRGRQDLAHRRPPEDDRPSRGVCNAVREVRLALADAREGERRLEPFDVVDRPRGHGGDVDADGLVGARDAHLIVQPPSTAIT